MNRQELVKQLCSEVTGRIARHHSDPSSVFITVIEMEELAQLFPSILILEAMNQTAKVVKKHPTTERMVMLRTVQNVAKSLLQQGQALGKHLKFGKVQAAPTPAPIPVRRTQEEIVEPLRELFQDACTYADWCLSEPDVEQLLRSYSENTLRETFKVLGRFSEDQQAVCFDDLQRLLDQSAWESATQELTR